MKFRRRAAARGLTLIEVLVSLAVMAMVASLIYGAYDAMAKSRAGVEQLGDRYHQGRSAIERMSRELQSAYLSIQDPIDTRLVTRATLLVGTSGHPTSRVDFTSFSHLRVTGGTHESDQNELSYFGSPNPRGGTDLVRRESKYIDMDPQHGGVVQVLAEDIVSFQLSYLDGINAQWADTWDSTSSQSLRLPQQVRIDLVLANRGYGQQIPFSTKVILPIQLPLSFAVPR